MSSSLVLKEMQYCQENKEMLTSNIRDLSDSEAKNDQFNHSFYHDFQADDKLDSFLDHSSNEIYQLENCFQESLAKIFLKGNLTRVQGNLILKVLRSHQCLSYLPIDTRTLLHIIPAAPQVKNVDSGEYLHLGLEYALIRILKRTPISLISDTLNVDWNTDGVKLNNSGKLQLWPIQITVSNIFDCKPEVVGIYKGTSKLLSPK